MTTALTTAARPVLIPDYPDRLVPVDTAHIRIDAEHIPAALAAVRLREQSAGLRDTPVPAGHGDIAADLAHELRRFGFHGVPIAGAVYVLGFCAGWVSPADLAVLQDLAPHLPDDAYLVLAERHREDQPLYALTVRDGALHVSDDVEPTTSYDW